MLSVALSLKGDWLLSRYNLVYVDRKGVDWLNCSLWFGLMWLMTKVVGLKLGLSLWGYFL